MMVKVVKCNISHTDLDKRFADDGAVEFVFSSLPSVNPGWFSYNLSNKVGVINHLGPVVQRQVSLTLG